MSFHVGQKVVCVDPSWGCDGDFQREMCPNLPVKGRIYTVREIMFFKGYPTGFMRLCEVVNPIKVDREPYFMVTKYHPLIERKTDISIFTELLIPTKHRNLVPS